MGRGAVAIVALVIVLIAGCSNSPPVGPPAPSPRPTVEPTPPCKEDSGTLKAYAQRGPIVSVNLVLEGKCAPYDVNDSRKVAIFVNGIQCLNRDLDGPRIWKQGGTLSLDSSTGDCGAALKGGTVGIEVRLTGYTRLSDAVVLIPG